MDRKNIIKVLIVAALFFAISAIALGFFACYIKHNGPVFSFIAALLATSVAHIYLSRQTEVMRKQNDIAEQQADLADLAIKMNVVITNLNLISDLRQSPEPQEPQNQDNIRNIKRLRDENLKMKKLITPITARLKERGMTLRNMSGKSTTRNDAP